MSYKSAFRPEVEGKRYHINLEEGQLPRYVLLPGDPDRVDEICSFLNGSSAISSHREFKIAKGTYGGVELGICSTGIGGPSTAIAIEELASIGCDTFIRVGSTGAINKDIGCGELIVNTSSVNLGGTAKEYVRAEYPSCSNHEVTLALIQSCELNNFHYHVGIGASTDSFYVGQARPALNGYIPSDKENLIEDLRDANVLNFEMEASTLFTLSNLFGLRSGSVCAVYANRETDVFEVKGESDAILSALGAVKILNEWDNAKIYRNKRFFYPGLLK